MKSGKRETGSLVPTYRALVIGARSVLRSIHLANLGNDMHSNAPRDLDSRAQFPSYPSLENSIVMEERERIHNEILRLVQERGPGKTICPSEVARKLESTEAAWRELMPLVREIGCELQSSGNIQVLQKGKLVSDPQNARGPIRYRLAPS